LAITLGLASGDFRSPSYGIVKNFNVWQDNYAKIASLRFSQPGVIIPNDFSQLWALTDWVGMGKNASSQKHADFALISCLFRRKLAKL
jgi:hypothetical protein